MSTSQRFTISPHPCLGGLHVFCDQSPKVEWDLPFEILPTEFLPAVNFTNRNFTYRNFPRSLDWKSPRRNFPRTFNWKSPRGNLPEVEKGNFPEGTLSSGTLPYGIFPEILIGILPEVFFPEILITSSSLYTKNLTYPHMKRPGGATGKCTRIRAICVASMILKVRAPFDSNSFSSFLLKFYKS